MLAGSKLPLVAPQTPVVDVLTELSSKGQVRCMEQCRTLDPCCQPRPLTAHSRGQVPPTTYSAEACSVAAVRMTGKLWP